MKYKCPICGYIYDEEKEGVKFSDLDGDYVCPICGAPKDLFEMLVEKEEVNKVVDKDMVELKPLYLAAIFSNLARGALKQYRYEEEKLFLELADYFTNLVPNIKEANIEDVLSLLNEDKNLYEETDKIALENNDRGTRRICTWGSKVSSAIKTILNKYQKEGTKFLEGKTIYQCSICGFIYIGDVPPQICLVCKVGSSKFIKGDLVK